MESCLFFTKLYMYGNGFKYFKDQMTKVLLFQWTCSILIGLPLCIILQKTASKNSNALKVNPVESQIGHFSHPKKLHCYK